jgi:hypothetical protein
MPVLIYLVVVGPILLGIIAMSNVMLGPPKGLGIGTAWHGLPKHRPLPTAVAVARYQEYQPIPLPPEAAAAMASENAQFSLAAKASENGTKIAERVATSATGKQGKPAKQLSMKQASAKQTSTRQASVKPALRKQASTTKARRHARRSHRYRQYARLRNGNAGRYW